MIVLAGFASPLGAAPPRPRFEAQLADGKRIEGAALVEWHTNSLAPRIDAHKLLDPANPFHWLRDRHLRPSALRSPRIEMHSGDILPGVVASFVSDRAEGPVRPDRFLVRSSITLTPQAQSSTPLLEVFTQFVRRIVWTESAQRDYQPNTAFLRDGRRVLFRAIRFGSVEARLRTTDGVRTIGFSELAELHMPPTPSWNAHLDELALLTPDGQSRLLQIETTEGLIATTSMVKTQAYRRGSPTEFEKWIHGVQPAWCRQMLWTPTNLIWMRRSYAAHEAPLSRIRPKLVVSRSSLNGSAHRWRINRSRDGHSLRSNGHEFGWGYGGHAYLELQFAQHPLMRRFRGQFGLDRLAAGGGCVQARVTLDSPSGQPLAASPVLAGQHAPHPFDIALDPKNASRGLVLSVDPVDKNAPDGADPLDIRDAVDWLNPMLILDPLGTRDELARRSIGFVPAWQRWSVTSAPPRFDGKPPKADLSWRVYWDTSVPSPGRFARGIVVRERPFRLSRSVRFEPGRHQWLLLMNYRPLNEKEDVWIEVRVDGVPVGRQRTPLRESGKLSYDPLVFKLPTNAAKTPATSLIEVIQEPSAKGTPVVWAGCEIVDSVPRVRTLIDERELAPPLAADGSPAARDSDSFAGVSSVRLRPGQPYRLNFDPPLIVKDTAEYNTLRYIQFAYRKKDGGRIGVILHHRDEELRPTRYHLGPTPYVFDRATGIQSGKLGDRWLVGMRDIVGDFGALELTGISFVAPDGGDVLIDQCCLAEHPNALAPLAQGRRIAPAFEARWAKFKEQMRDHATAGLVHLQVAGGGSFVGALISANGDILTSAACLRRLKGATAKATLSDGRQFDAKPLGTARSHSCGLLHVDAKSPTPYLAIANQHHYAKGELMVRARCLEEKTRTFSPRLVAFETDGHIWTASGKESEGDPSRSSLLLDASGAVVGFDWKLGPCGELVTRCRDLPASLDKIRKAGSTIGEWSAGAQPPFGARFKIHKSGLEVLQLTAGSPAAKAGLQTGDIITKFGDRETLSISDIVDESRSHNPGESMPLRFQRKAENKEATFQFAP
jgi:hypothetical protein